MNPQLRSIFYYSIAHFQLDDVLSAHAGTIKVLHRLKPLGVAMAGRDVIDPYKD